MARICWSVAAQADLDDIERYVRRDSPTRARRVGDRIVAAVEALSEFPLSGRSVPEFRRADLREVILWSYRIIYVVRDDEVRIARIVHGARDLLKFIRDEGWDMTG